MSPHVFCNHSVIKAGLRLLTSASKDGRACVIGSIRCERRLRDTKKLPVRGIRMAGLCKDGRLTFFVGDKRCTLRFGKLRSVREKRSAERAKEMIELLILRQKLP